MPDPVFREVTLPSGAILKIAPAPFADAKALFQAFLKEVRNVPMTTNADNASWTWFLELYKNVYSAAFSSQEVERCMWACAARCLYDDGTMAKEIPGLKVEPSIFEKAANRQDFETVAMEVTKENVDPFAKSLYAKYLSASKELKAATQE